MRVTRIATDTTSQLIFETAVENLGYVPGDTIEITHPAKLAGMYKILDSHTLQVIDALKGADKQVDTEPPLEQPNKPWYRAMKHGNKYGRK